MRSEKMHWEKKIVAREVIICLCSIYLNYNIFCVFLSVQVQLGSFKNIKRKKLRAQKQQMRCKGGKKGSETEEFGGGLEGS